MTTFPNASRQVRTGTQGPLVHLQSLDGRGMARLAAVCTRSDGALSDYTNVSVVCGGTWVFEPHLMTAAPGAVFAAFTQPMGGAHRSYIGLYDLDRCPDLAAASRAWAKMRTVEESSRIPVAERPDPSWVYTQFADVSIDGAIAVGTGGRVVWVPVPPLGVDLNDHIAAVLAGRDRLTGPVAMQVLALADAAREAGGRVQVLTVGATTLARLLREWLATDAEGRIEELLQIADPATLSSVCAGVQVGPLSVLLAPTMAESPKVDHAWLMWAAGPRMNATSHFEDRALLAGCLFWIGPQDAPLASTYAALRASGLSPESAAIALTAATAS